MYTVLQVKEGPQIRTDNFWDIFQISTLFLKIIPDYQSTKVLLFLKFSDIFDPPAHDLLNFGLFAEVQGKI